MTLNPNRLRLQVETDPAPGVLVNLNPNPSGEYGGYGYLTPLAGTAVSGDLAYGLLTFTTPNTSSSSFTTEDVLVTPGTYIAFSVWAAPALAGATWTFYDANGGNLGSTSATLTQNVNGSIGGVDQVNAAASPIVVPTNAATARVTIVVSGKTAYYFRNFIIATASTAAALGVAHTNLIANSSFETDTSGWSSPTALARTTAQHWTGAASLAVTNTFASAAPVQAQSVAVAVTPGQAYSASAYVRTASALTATIGIYWLDSIGNLIDYTESAATATSTAWSRVSKANGVAPASAVQALISIKANGVAASGQAWIDGVLLEASATVNAWYAGTYYSGGVLPLVPNAYWTDLLGDANSIQVDRSELNTGTLTARILSTDLDPAVSTALRPGRRVQLLANTTGTTWENVYTGRLATASVEYLPVADDAAKRAAITLAAVDGIAALAQHSRPNGVATIAGLPAVLEGCGVPWNMGGNAGQVTTPATVAVNADATALDQVAIVRDSVGGYAWLDRRGILKAWTAATISTSVRDTLTADDYLADLGVSFNTDRAVNIVNIDALMVDSKTGETVTVKYGPYRDEPSIRAWGPLARTYTVQGLTGSQVASLAASILAANRTPVRAIDYVKLPVSDATVGDFATLDLYDLLTVTNDVLGLTSNLRVVGISHTITATEDGATWTIRLDFGANGSSAPPQVVPAPDAGALAGGWSNIALASGYTVTGGSDEPATWKQDGTTVRLAGVVKPTSGTFVAGTAVTISAAAAVPKPRGGSYTANRINVAASNGIARIIITTTGAIQVVPSTAAAWVAIACEYETL